MMVCPVYEQYRTQMLNELSFDAVFTHLNTSEKFVRLMKQYYKEAATYIQKSWLLRQSKLLPPALAGKVIVSVPSVRLSFCHRSSV